MLELLLCESQGIWYGARQVDVAVTIVADLLVDCLA